MRILIFHNFSQDFNGEDAYFLSTKDLLIKNRHQVISYTKRNKNIRNILSTKLKIASQLFISYQVEKEVSEIIKKLKPKVVHFHNIYPLISPIAYRVCKTHDIPIIQTIHNYRFMCSKAVLFRNAKICDLCVRKKFPYPSIIFGCYHDSYVASSIFTPAMYYHKNITKSFDGIDTYIFPSTFTRDYYVKNLKIPLKKTTLLPYSVPFSKINQHNHKVSNYFLFVGRLSEEKGILQILSVFSFLTSYKLIVLGDGPLRKKVDQYNRFKNIFIRGFVSHVKIHSYFRKAICTIIPSLWYEVLPLVMLESFANSTPVIVPKFGTFADTVTEKITGLFYEQYNLEDLRRKIIWASKNKEEMHKMGLNARKDYENKYTPEIHYNKLMQVYKNVLRSKKVALRD